MAVMSQADDVRASLLASHDRDAVVRRKVADEVRLAAINGAGGVADVTVKAASLVAQGCTAEARELVKQGLREAGTAAAAVVLASDLRAPIPHGAGAWGPGDPMATTTELDAIEGGMRDLGIPMTSTDAGRAKRDEDGYYPTKIDTAAELAAAHESAKAFVDRERLAEVKRLLIEGMEDAGTSSLPFHRMRDALSIVRSLLGGE